MQSWRRQQYAATARVMRRAETAGGVRDPAGSVLRDGSIALNTCSATIPKLLQWRRKRATFNRNDSLYLQRRPSSVIVSQACIERSWRDRSAGATSEPGRATTEHHVDQHRQRISLLCCLFRNTSMLGHCTMCAHGWPTANTDGTMRTTYAHTGSWLRQWPFTQAMNKSLIMLWNLAARTPSVHQEKGTPMPSVRLTTGHRNKLWHVIRTNKVIHR